MAASNMKELLKHELGDLLYAEQLILKMLGTLTREVQNPEMLARVQEHIGETEEQIERLRRAFESVGEKAKAEKCDAAIGLKEEHDSFKKEEKPSKQLLEAFDLGNSLRVEHYEIAGYRSAIAVATVLGERECVALLTESLREEEAMATFIERSSVKALKALSAGMDLASGAAEVVLTPPSTGSSRSRSSGSKSSSSGGKSSGSKSSSGSSSSRSSSSRSNGRSTTSEGSSSGGRSSSSKSSGGGKPSSSGGSSSSRSSSSKSGGGKSSSGSSASRSSGGSSSRTTSERSSSGGSSSRSSGSKSGGSSSSSKSNGSSGSSSSRSSSSKSSGGSKSGGSKSGSSRSRSGGSGSSART
jgi:ferritin-like metal-binding protein YciE